MNPNFIKLRELIQGGFAVALFYQMSFRRNVPGSETSTVNIPGVRRWLGGVYLASSGISGLDEALGGGIPVKSLVLVKNDDPSYYYLTILRCFVAEGIARGHCVVKCSPTKLIANEMLPLVVNMASSLGSKPAVISDKLKIPWRYKNLQLQSSHVAPVTPVSFNLSRPMDREMLNLNTPLDISLRSFSRFPISTDEYYDDLLCCISCQLKSKRCDGESPFNVGRIALESIISPYLSFDPTASLRPLIRFLHQLRRLARTTFAIFMVSMPIHIMNANDSNRFEHLFDFVLNVHSFTGCSSVYGNKDGLIRVERLGTHHLKINRPESIEFLFEMTKTEISIERVSLPVEDPAQEDQVELAPSCSGTNLPKALEF